MSDIKKPGVFSLLKMSLSLLREHFVATLVTFLIIAIPSLYLQIIEEPFSHSNTPLSAQIIIWNIVAMYVYFIAFLAYIKVLDGQCSMAQSLVHFFKKSIPVVVTLVIVVIGFALAALAAVFLVALIPYYSSSAMFYLMLAASVLAALVVMFYMMRFSIFLFYVMGIEDAYYLGALKSSFAASKGNIWAFFYRNVAIYLIIILPSLLVIFLVSSAIGVSIIAGGEALAVKTHPFNFPLKISLALTFVSLIAQQILFATNYILYKYIKG